MMDRIWKIGIVKDSSKPMLGLHGLHAVFLGLPNVDIAAYVDSHTENLPQKMSRVGAKRHYTTLRDMLEHEALDIVVLCSRHPCDHSGQIQAAAERGFHVYCDKPLTADLREADSLVDLAETKHVKICIAHPARYDPAHLTLKQMIEKGEIGIPITVYGRGKSDPRGGGEDLIVLGTHILDLQTFLFGPPHYVFADVTAEGRPIVKTDRVQTVEPIGPAAGDEVFAYFRFPGGVRGIFERKRGLSDKKSGIAHMGISVTGTTGTLSLRFDDGQDRPLRISRRAGPLEADSCFEDVPVTEQRVIPGAEPLDYSLCGQPDIPRARFILEANRFAAWDLMRAIEEDRQPDSNVYHARLALEMIYGIYTSHLAGKRIRFPLTDRTHPLGELQ